MVFFSHFICNAIVTVLQFIMDVTYRSDEHCMVAFSQYQQRRRCDITFVHSLFYTVNAHTMAFIYPFSSFTLCIDLRHVYYLYNNVVLAMTMPI